MAALALVKGSVALITLKNPPVNALSAAVREGIVYTVTRALDDPKVKSVVICGQNGKFCGGADVKEFSGTMTGPPMVPMFHAIEAGDKPVVAAIEGIAFGGGLELALCCHYRIAQSKALVALPEVTLGLLPAACGSQRLPRLIGVLAALDIITTGRHVTAAEALQLGIVDQVIEDDTVAEAVKFAQSVEGKSLDDRRLCNRQCPPLPDLDAVFERVMQQVRKRARGAKAPVACVQAVKGAAILPYAEGLKLEQELMATLFRSDQARALQYCFFAERHVGRWSLPSGASWDTVKPRPIHKAAVIGLGTMGRGITAALVQAGVSVVAVETQEQQLAEAKLAVSGMLERWAKKRRVAPPLALIHYSPDLQGVADVDLVIEAVFEDMAVKENIFRQLSVVCKPGTLLFSNTSSLDVNRLASCARNPELVVGMHFFAPAHIMRLLEVVCGPRSSPEAVATAMHLGKRMGKVSVAVGNCPGFVGNRMLVHYMEQAGFLLEEGASPEQVDSALEEFGFPMGPFKMSDLSGTDVGWKIRKEAGLTGLRFPPWQPKRVRQGRRYSPLADLICEQGRFGQKTGRGWYQYDKPGGREARPDPWLQTFLEEYRAEHSLVARHISQKEVLERCLYALINEGFCILEEGIAAGPQEIDMIYVFGYGWPRHHGGPMFYASTVGLASVLERLEDYHHAHHDVPYLEPSRLLRRLVASGCPPIHKWAEVIKKHQSQL